MTFIELFISESKQH